MSEQAKSFFSFLHQAGMWVILALVSVVVWYEQQARADAKELRNMVLNDHTEIEVQKNRLTNLENTTEKILIKINP